MAKSKLDALLNKAKRLSERRNKFIHRPWAKNAQGEWVVKDGEHEWGPPPSVEELNLLASDISQAMNELNDGRLRGFIKEAASGSRA